MKSLTCSELALKIKAPPRTLSRLISQNSIPLSGCKTYNCRSVSTYDKNAQNRIKNLYKNYLKKALDKYPHYINIVRK